jgi:hypothetical protein
MNRILVRALRALAAGVLIAAVPAAVPAAATAGPPNGAPCPRPPDVAPPSTPANLRSSFPGNARIQLDWSPSTDDRGVTGYQVFLNNNQIAAVTGTTFAQIIPPPLSFVYRVRAVDAAGNLSPFAVLRFGFPVDTVAPSVPGTPRLTVHDGMLQADWDPATDNVAIAGYEVTENGVVISRTSGLRAFGPYSIPGVFTVRVRAFDGAGNFGPAGIQVLAVDPVPAPPGQPS